MRGSSDRHSRQGLDDITELDLHAYADHRLEADPARRALVERYLAERPAEAARIADIRDQNAALARAGAVLLEEPVPERLLAAVRGEGRPRRRLPLKAAAVAALVVVSAAGGWLANSDEARDPDSLRFAVGALLDYRQQAGHSPGTALPPHGHRAPGARASSGDRQPVESLLPGQLPEGGLTPITWLRRYIAMEIEVPDLSQQGYRLIESRRIELDGEPAVRLLYRDAEGQQASLYLRPRWKAQAEDLQQVESDGLSVLHWPDGPLALALVTETRRRSELKALANQVRQAVERATLVKPGLDGPISQDARLLADPPPAPAPQNALPTPRDPGL